MKNSKSYILPKLRSLDSSITELGLYFDKTDLEYFTGLYSNYLKIYYVLLALWTNDSVQFPVVKPMDPIHMTTVEKMNYFKNQWYTIAEENQGELEVPLKHLRRNLKIK